MSELRQQNLWNNTSEKLYWNLAQQTVKLWYTKGIRIQDCLKFCRHCTYYIANFADEPQTGSYNIWRTPDEKERLEISDTKIRQLIAASLD